jgi:hypothetical protein
MEYFPYMGTFNEEALKNFIDKVFNNQVLNTLSSISFVRILQLENDWIIFSLSLSLPLSKD